MLFVNCFRPAEAVCIIYFSSLLTICTNFLLLNRKKFDCWDFVCTIWFSIFNNLYYKIRVIFECVWWKVFSVKNVLLFFYLEWMKFYLVKFFFILYVCCFCILWSNRDWCVFGGLGWWWVYSLNFHSNWCVYKYTIDIDRFSFLFSLSLVLFLVNWPSYSQLIS